MIRPATSADHPRILQIFNDEVSRSVYHFHTEPLTGEAAQQWLALHESPKYPLFVIEEEGIVLGWSSLSPWAPHGGYAHTAELSFFVAPEGRGKKLGSRLLEHLVEVAPSLGTHVLLGRIEASNEASRYLHLKYGFRSVGVMHEVGYKFGQYLDVEIFEKNVGLIRL